MLKFKCKDVGFQCGFTAKGKTEEEILSQCAVHATKDHGMKPEEITDDLRTKSKLTFTNHCFDLTVYQRNQDNGQYYRSRYSIMDRDRNFTLIK
jgi:predicted small metal-binding protein